ncbi:MAG TPA: SUMF1/EgtB/PvdO family nonheme iron enzyme [Candidatus Baltobacteraceae bacterium]
MDIHALGSWYRRNRARSERIFGLIDEDALHDRPIPLRHPFVFYQGHLPAFSYRTLNERALGQAPIDAALEKLFERGIDPRSQTQAERLQPQTWPSPQEIAEFGQRCDERVLDALANARLDDPSVPRLRRGQSAYTILEHEQMHHETLLYLIHQLPYDRKTQVKQVHLDTTPPRNDLVMIPAGRVTLGARPDEIPFGWDNEFGASTVNLPSFAIQRFPVTNGDWLAFVRAGGAAAPFWRERDGRWFLQAAFEELPLPLSWPVYVSHDAAAAYAAWAGMALPSEAQYHRAAFGAPDGSERAFPWGDDQADAGHGNFDFARFDPEPVDAHPDGASAWGVHDLVGNGWEWTSTPFGPHLGFEPMASYPQYSADFFDGKHFVMKGASPVTAREMIRPSFRNWFYGDYPYAYTKFRYVQDVSR